MHTHMHAHTHTHTHTHTNIMDKAILRNQVSASLHVPGLTTYCHGVDVPTPE